jgi:hypothetical protein
MTENILTEVTPLVPAVIIKKKGPHWKASKDLQLVKSWLDISQDPVVGNEQPSSKFWRCIHESFVKAQGKIEQGESALLNRWRVIEQNVSKLSGDYTAIESRNISGKTFDNRIQDACVIHESQLQATFTMLPLWLLLHSTRKWKDLLSESHTQKQSKCPASNQLIAVQERRDDKERTEQNDCPMGKKKARKRNREEGGSIVESG